MKSKITITLIAILLCAVISYGFVLSRTSQNDISYDNPDGRVGEIAPGLVFKIDTGSDLSTITAEGLAILEKMGYNPRKEIYPVLGRDGVGDIQLSATRYKIDLPFHHKVYENDSTTYNEIINVIHNVDFAPSKNGSSVLGIDFLQKFKIEYQYHNKALNLYVKLPAGYVQCVDLSYSKALMTSIWLGKRYYIPISIESDENNYFIDTGLQKVGAPVHRYRPVGTRAIQCINRPFGHIVVRRSRRRVHSLLLRQRRGRICDEPLQPLHSGCAHRLHRPETISQAHLQHPKAKIARIGTHITASR